ncbi:unnamed protein product [Ixodes persulcatus]
MLRNTKQRHRCTQRLNRPNAPHSLPDQNLDSTSKKKVDLKSSRLQEHGTTTLHRVDKKRKKKCTHHHHGNGTTVWKKFSNTKKKKHTMKDYISMNCCNINKYSLNYTAINKSQCEKKTR